MRTQPVVAGIGLQVLAIGGLVFNFAGAADVIHSLITPGQWLHSSIAWLAPCVVGVALIVWGVWASNGKAEAPRSDDAKIRVTDSDYVRVKENEHTGKRRFFEGRGLRWLDIGKNRLRDE